MFHCQLETLNRTELQALQLQRLRDTVERAQAQVPFYKRLFAGSDLSDAGALRTLEQIQKLPFTTKSNLRDNYPFGLLAVQRDAVRRVHASSGTRGKPTVSLYTESDINTWSELCARSLAAAGVSPGDTVQNSYGYGLFTGGLGIHYGVEKLGGTVVPASSGRTQQQIMMLQDFEAKVLCCTPSYALNIALCLTDNAIELTSLALRIGIFGAEPWTESCRRHIEEKLQIKAFDIYGLSEILGPGIAVECLAQAGMHIWEDHFYPEIIDPVSGEPLSDGEAGELVLTTLTKEAIPLIRYRTGDVCAFINEPCSCGRTMRRISRLQGRLDDMLIIRGVNVYPSEVEDVLFSRIEVSPQYQIVITRDKALDSMTVRVEVNHEMQNQWRHDHTEETNRRNLEQELSDLLRQRLGLTAAVEIIEPNILPRSEGKAVRVLDLRNNSE
jgi:phenylacetate-CoA ligase